MTTEYKRCIVYIKTNNDEPWGHWMYDDKESALNHVRKIKEQLGKEPKVDLVDNNEADVLHFSFKDTGIRGRIVFLKRELMEWIHCPQCGNTMGKGENDEARCHQWVGKWSFDGDNNIWRLSKLEKEEVNKVW